ncbi:hypothetical protein L227DRAFT_106292 [Lentinus tigrinus ALCF2SS1-6]|uniref:Uncharacterized protein n=1 Tax=Lentinus tigrinus ALCF2SS1-6 TaxID=1328759 RepID=A0A5C2SAA1_9APHY|nr:hypothetical protein L227DRAFT_106292 [Lentinus tigrinus ALCF2SS1-6]
MRSAKRPSCVPSSYAWGKSTRMPKMFASDNTFYSEEVPEEDQPAAEPEPAPAPQPQPSAPAAQAPPPCAAAPVPAPVRAPAIPPPRRTVEDRRSSSRSSRSPLHEIAVPFEAKAGPSNALPINAVEHADDEGEPRRRRIPSRANRSPSREPPPRARDRSRYFPTPDDASRSSSVSSAKVTLRGPGTEASMRELARTMGLSPPRPANIELSDSEEEDLYAIALAPRKAAASGTGTRNAAKLDTRQKSKQKATLPAEPGSDDFGSDDFELNDEMLRAIDHAEKQAYQKGSNGSQSQSQSQVQAQTQTKVKAEVLSQASATLAVTATSSTAVASRATSGMGSGSGPASRATSVPGTSSSGSKGGTGGADLSVITISDDEEDIEKENVPIPTRHIRRRIEPHPNNEVIELSD